MEACGDFYAANLCTWPKPNSNLTFLLVILKIDIWQKRFWYQKLYYPSEYRKTYLQFKNKLYQISNYVKNSTFNYLFFLNCLLISIKSNKSLLILEQSACVVVHNNVQNNKFCSVPHMRKTGWLSVDKMLIKFTHVIC